MVQQAKCNLEMRFDIDITTLTSIAQRPGEVQGVKDITWGKSHSIYGEIKSSTEIFLNNNTKSSSI